MAGNRIDRKSFANLQLFIVDQLTRNHAVRRTDLYPLTRQLDLPPSAVERIWNSMKRGAFTAQTGIPIITGEYKGKGVVKHAQEDEPTNILQIMTAIDREWHETALASGKLRIQREAQQPRSIKWHI